VVAAVATIDARRTDAGPARSVRVAVPVPVTMPAESPDRNRPAKSQARLEAKMKARVLSALSPSAAARMGRLSTWSEDRPARSSATSAPAAYVAKTSVRTPEENRHFAW